eukprot:PhM_4_TR2436/c2_g2_i1/m.78605
MTWSPLIANLRNTRKRTVILSQQRLGALAVTPTRIQAAAAGKSPLSSYTHESVLEDLEDGNVSMRSSKSTWRSFRPMFVVWYSSCWTVHASHKDDQFLEMVE